MASETSELTFVRCPSCRSLVPATAARCRICNNALEGGAKPNDATGSRATGRVRQKTISATTEELMNAEVEHETATAQEASAVSSSGREKPSLEADVDPLSAYLQELEDEGTVEPKPAASAAPSELEDDLDDFFQELAEIDKRESSTAAKAAASVTAESFDEPDVFANELSTVMEQEAPAPAAKPAPSKPVERVAPVSPPRHTQPKQQADTREPAAPQRVEARPEPSSPRNERVAQDNRSGRDGKSGQGAGGERRESKDRFDGGKPARSVEDGRRSPPAQPRQEGRPHDRGEVTTEQKNVGPRMGKVRPGRLFGWLVSFESPDGRAIELREGKFFVTATSIRGTDLVIEDPSISTPHAMMSVSSESGLLVQDLMSDRGIFVRSGERGQYRREDGIVEIKHGDWIRFGDVEFLVTVVPVHN